MDDTILKDMLAETSVNNTFDITSVEYTNKMLSENSFWYLYQLQKDYIVFKEYHFKTKNSNNDNATAFGDMYLDVNGRVCIDVDTELIHLHKRHNFYHSKFYKEELSLTDIQNNPELFQRIPLLIIDNKSIFDYKIRMNEKYVTFILPFKMDFILYGDRQYKEHTTDLFLFANKLKVYNLTTNKSMLNQYGGVDTVPASLINKSLTFENGGTYFVFIMSKSGYFHSTFQTAQVETSKLLRVTMDDEVLKSLQSSSGNITLKIYYIEGLHEHKPYNSVMTSIPMNAIEIKSQVALIERKPGVHYNMPIPTENTMVLKLDRATKGWVSFKENTTSIKYPNMYIINDDNMVNRDKYRLFYFYHIGYDLHYEHIFDFWYKFLGRKFPTLSMEEIINKMYFGDLNIFSSDDLRNADKWFKTFKEIFNYVDHKYSYGTVDYVKYENNQSPFEYKVNKLKDFIKYNQDALRQYVLTQNKTRDNYELYVKNVDLPSRVRYNTDQELKYNHLDFGGEPYYVFQFSNVARNGLLTMRLFIDGLFNVNYYHIYENLVDYIYIPAEDLTETSYIEIEMFHSYEYSTQVAYPYVNYSIELSLSPKNNSLPTKKDLIFTNGITGETLDSGLFKIERLVDGVYYDIDYINEDLSEDSKRYEVDFSVIDNIRITALEESVTNIYVNIDIFKKSYLRVVKPSMAAFPSTSIKNVKFNGDIDYLRLFVNGRLLSRNMMSVRYGGGNVNVQAFVMCYPGDTFVIDITPYKYEHIYTTDKLEDTRYPIVDLKDYIDKPIDVRYYDIFLNGRKLTKNEVYPLNSHLVTFTNIHSLNGLTIFQKDRDYEYFGVDYTEYDYPFDIGDLINKDEISDDDKNDIIKNEVNDTKDNDIPDNPITDDEEEILIEPDENMLVRLFYYTELMPLEYVTPNEVQFLDEAIETDFEEDIYIPYMVHRDIDNAIKSGPITGIYTISGDDSSTFYVSNINTLDLSDTSGQSKQTWNPYDYTTNNVLLLNPDVHAMDADEIYLTGGDALNERDEDIVEEPNG